MSLRIITYHGRPIHRKTTSSLSSWTKYFRGYSTTELTISTVSVLISFSLSNLQFYWILEGLDSICLKGTLPWTMKRPYPHSQTLLSLWAIFRTRMPRLSYRGWIPGDSDTSWKITTAAIQIRGRSNWSSAGAWGRKSPTFLKLLKVMSLMTVLSGSSTSNFRFRIWWGWHVSYAISSLLYSFLGPIHVGPRKHSRRRRCRSYLHQFFVLGGLPPFIAWSNLRLSQSWTRSLLPGVRTTWTKSNFTSKTQSRSQTCLKVTARLNRVGAYLQMERAIKEIIEGFGVLYGYLGMLAFSWSFCRVSRSCLMTILD